MIVSTATTVAQVPHGFSNAHHTLVATICGGVGTKRADTGSCSSSGRSSSGSSRSSRPAAAGAPMPAAQAAPKSAEEAVQYLAKVGPDLISTANLLRRANLKDPLAYRLMRQGLYLHIVNRLLAPYTQDFESWNGAWSTGVDDSKDKFVISFSPGAPSALSELAEDWLIIKMDDNVMQFEHTSGGNGDTDVLHFEHL